MDPRWLRNSFIYLLVLVAVVAVFFTLFPPSQPGKSVDISQVMAMARNGEVEKIEVQGDQQIVVYRTAQVGGDKVRSRKEASASIFDILEKGGVDLAKTNIAVDVKEP